MTQQDRNNQSGPSTSTAGQQVRPAARRKARRFVLQALYQWHMTGYPLNEIDAQFQTDNNMKKVDVTYFHELLHGIPACIDDLDDSFTPLLDRKFKDLDPIELNILRIATYEFIKRIDVPYKVVINEGIELAKTFGATESHKYINGILDRLAPTLRADECGAANKK